MSHGTVVAPLVVDGIEAEMAKALKFEAVYMQATAVASALGLRSAGLITFTEMADELRILTSASDIPVVADAQTGYGNYVNVFQTVRLFERMGVAALHLSDNVWPQFHGAGSKERILDRAEAVTKIKSAADARTDPDFVIIARTDSLATGGWNEIEDRVRAYIEAGADMGFVEGLEDMDGVQACAQRLAGIPLVFDNARLLSTRRLQGASHDLRLILHPFAAAMSRKAFESSLQKIASDDVPEAPATDPRPSESTRFYLSGGNE
jgi:2-methylisocitrate lyase-like PEP mutase family enzyme